MGNVSESRSYHDRVLTWRRKVDEHTAAITYSIEINVDDITNGSVRKLTSEDCAELSSLVSEFIRCKTRKVAVQNKQTCSPKKLWLGMHKYVLGNQGKRED